MKNEINYCGSNTGRRDIVGRAERRKASKGNMLDRRFAIAPMMVGRVDPEKRNTIST
jgi:hypothetical protein